MYAPVIVNWIGQIYISQPVKVLDHGHAIFFTTVATTYSWYSREACTHSINCRISFHCPKNALRPRMMYIQFFAFFMGRLHIKALQPCTMPHSLRKPRHSFRSSLTELRCISATIAFGMVHALHVLHLSLRGWTYVMLSL